MKVSDKPEFQLNIDESHISKKSSSTNNNSLVVEDNKSLFERAIIEAFKEKEEMKITTKLKIALDEIKFYVQEIKELNQTQSGKSYLINSNIIDKLSRLTSRRLFYVKIMIGRIYNSLITEELVPILTNNNDLLFKFSNEVLNLQEDIKTTSLSYSLQKKLLILLKFMTSLQNIDYEQEQIIKELMKSFSSLNSIKELSLEDFNQISLLCKSNDKNKKLDGVSSLIQIFSNTTSLEQQIYILIHNVPSILKAFLFEPKPEYKEAYFNFGNFLFSMLYNLQYTLDADIGFYSMKENRNENSLFFVYNDIVIDKTQSEMIKKYNNSKYSLVTGKQSPLTDELFRMCLQLVTTISSFSKLFDLQYISYVILKRLYFVFPNFRKHLEELISTVLVNICLFTEDYNIKNSEECRTFISYLQLNDRSSITEKLNSKIQFHSANVEKKLSMSNEQSKFFMICQFSD